MLALWQHLTWKGSATGTIGNDSSNPSMMWTPNSPTSPLMTALNSSQPLLSMFALAPVAKAIKFELALSRLWSAPLVRLSNWMDSQTLYTVLKDVTGCNLNDSLKVFDTKTHQHSISLPSPLA